MQKTQPQIHTSAAAQGKPLVWARAQADIVRPGYTMCSKNKVNTYHIAGSKLAPALGVSLLEQCAIVTDGKDLQSAQHMIQAQSNPKAVCRRPVKTTTRTSRQENKGF